jgi:hypothetical protein
MAFLTQNMNQFIPAAILGQVDQIPQPSVVSVQFSPASASTATQNGCTMKLVAGASGAMVVDVHLGPTDTAQVFGVIPYNERKNLYLPGDIMELALVGSVVYLKAGGTIARGDTVSSALATTVADPQVITDVTSGHYLTGVALDIATVGQLVRVLVQPSLHP